MCQKLLAEGILFATYLHGYVVRILLPQISLIVICLHIQQARFHFQNYSLQTLLHKCPLMFLECPLFVLERCPSYKELSYSKMTRKRPGPTEGKESQG